MSRSITKVAFAVSLALNVFILGAAAGALFWRSAPTPSQPPDQSLAAAADALEPTQRQAFREALAAARREAQSDSQTARDSRNRLAQLLNGATLDRSAIDAALEETRAADARVRARVEAAVIDYAESLDPKNRAILVGGLSARGQILPRSIKK